jgi:hypothetical protein
MASYRFLTVWSLEAPIESVWDALHDSDEWPRWWRGVVSVETLDPGDAFGLGGRRRYAMKSTLPYTLTFEGTSTLVERPTALAGTTEGELRGGGRFDLAQEGLITTVHYAWNVETTSWWMNLLGPVLRPVFVWNHDVLMRWGGDGLARRLGARLVASRSGLAE